LAKGNFDCVPVARKMEVRPTEKRGTKSEFQSVATVQRKLKSLSLHREEG